jgi:protein SCO1/2
MKCLWSRIALVLLLVVAVALSAQTMIAANRSVDPNPDFTDFALTDQTGHPFHLSQLHGKVVLLFFGYTHCPDACPTTMAKLASVNKLIGKDADRVMIVFVSVDPGRDTPDILKSYLAYFHMNSVGLTGTKAQIDEVVKQYGARYEIEQSDSAAGYHVNHSTDLYLLNQQGELVKTFGYGDATQVIVDGVRPLL